MCGSTISLPHNLWRLEQMPEHRATAERRLDARQLPGSGRRPAIADGIRAGRTSRAIARAERSRPAACRPVRAETGRPPALAVPWWRLPETPLPPRCSTSGRRSGRPPGNKPLALRRRSVGEDGGVEHDQGCVPRRRRRQRGKTSREVALDQIGRIATGELHGGAKAGQPCLLAGPDQVFEPGDILVTPEVDRVEVEAGTPHHARRHPWQRHRAIDGAGEDRCVPLFAGGPRRCPP
jgi:hypothetical protein